MADSSASRGRVASEERVFSLVLALVASPQGLTKHELLSSVYGYAERYRHGETDGALDRQFERDKDQVRQLGIPVVTVDDPAAPGDNRRSRYRISKEQLQLPADLRFTEQELRLLKLASFAWSEGSLGDESRWSSMRITSLSAGLDVRHLGIAPRLGMLEPAAPKLQQAIDLGRAVGFDYQLAERDTPLRRRVAPLRLHRAEGRWHLIAWDLDRDASRVFLLSRIASEVTLLSERVDPALQSTVEGVLDELQQLFLTQRVRVTVQPGSAAEARLAPRFEQSSEQRDHEEPDVTPPIGHEFGTLDTHALALEIAGFGDEVVVIGPKQMREQVIERLREVRAQHREGESHG